MVKVVFGEKNFTFGGPYPAFRLMKTGRHIIILKQIGLKMAKMLAILLIVFTFIPIAKCQPQQKKASFRELFTEGNLMMGEHFIDSALQTFLVLYPKDTNDANVTYFIGQLYLLTTSHRYQALPYLAKAAKHVDEKYRPDNPYEKDAPPQAYYYLARAQHLNYLFDDAITNFLKFDKLLKANDSRHKDVAYWINCCNNAKMLMETPVDCKVVNLGDSVNSRYPDYAPMMTADENDILFTSRRPIEQYDSTRDINGHYYEDIWTASSKPDGGWTTARDLGSPVDGPGNESTVSLSPDGQELILYRDNGNGGGALFVSRLNGYQWSYTNYIDSSNNGVINGGSYQPSACLSPDKKTIIFSSNKPGGLGGLDLYKITIDNTGKWSTPSNLGPSVNTEYDEDAPFIHPDDSTMFFSSKGHNTMGGYDVFSSKENAQGYWEHVKNIGYPINTPDDDIYFNVSPDGKRAFYTSVRQGGYGETDNYEVIFNHPLPVQPVAVLVGYIKNADGSPLRNDIKVSSSATNGSYSTSARVNNKTGKFLAILRPDQKYNVTISTQDNTAFNHDFYLSSDSSYVTLSRAFFRKTIVLGDTTNVFAPPAKKAVIAAVTPAVNYTSMNGRLLLNDDPLEPLSKMPVRLLDKNGKELQSTTTASDGYFTFGHLGTDSTYILEAVLKGSKIKQRLKKLLLVNTDNHTVRDYDEEKKRSYFYHTLPPNLNSLAALATKTNITTVETSTTTTSTANTKNTSTTKNVTVTDANQADFTRYFGYNVNDVSEDDAGFTQLIDKIAAKAAKGEVKITIDASASKVPTKLFHSSNKNLAGNRGKVAKEVILAALAKKNIDNSKISIEMTTGVNGPKYGHDANEESKYQHYQYVKVYIR